MTDCDFSNTRADMDMGRSPLVGAISRRVAAAAGRLCDRLGQTWAAAKLEKRDPEPSGPPEHLMFIWEDRKRLIPMVTDCANQVVAEGDEHAKARDDGYELAAEMAEDIAGRVARDVDELRAQAECLRWHLEQGSLWENAIDRRLADRIVEGLDRLDTSEPA